MSASAPPALIDTSLIVRYLTNDPPPAAARAAAIIDSDVPLLLSLLALVESAYVPTSVYGVSRSAVVEALTALVQRRNLQLPDLAQVRVVEALRLCRDSNVIPLPRS